MKRNLIFAAVLRSFRVGHSASAQKTTDFSGTWNLDVSKSKPAETIDRFADDHVTQTATDIKVERSTKMKKIRMAAAAAAGGGLAAAAERSRDLWLRCRIKIEPQTQMGAIEVTSKAKIDGNTLTLSRTITTPKGDRR